MEIQSYSRSVNKVIKDDGSVVYTCKGCGSEWSSPVSCGRHAGRCIDFIGEEKYKEFRAKIDSHKKPYIEPEHCYNKITHEDGSESYACKWCGKEFSTLISCRGHVVNCKSYLGEDHYKKWCDKIGRTGRSEETQRKRKETFMKNYGVDHPMKNEKVRQSIRQTCMERYGVPSAFNLPSVREKWKQSSLKRYGVENPFSSKEVQQSIQEKLIEHYGVDNPMKSEDIRKKAQDTNLERYGYHNASCSPEVVERIRLTNMERYGVPYYCLSEKCTRSNGVISRSNKKVAELLDQEGLISKFEHRLGYKSYDLAIIDENLLIEVDPTYTHNSTIGPVFGGNKCSPIDPEYHKEKSELANTYGFHCIHLFDWDPWELVVKLYSKHKTRIYARNCSVKEVNDPKTINDFLYKYHVQGGLRNSQSNKCIGLFYEDKLVAVMLFGKPRYNKKYQYELLRLCTDYHYQIVGGNQKLFKYFVSQYDPESIISYCDRAKFQGKVYSKLGFSYKNSTRPTAHWYNGKRHITDNLLRALGADKLIGTDYGKGTNNEEIMIAHGYVKIYDCGQYVYEWRRGHED